MSTKIERIHELSALAALEVIDPVEEAELQELCAGDPSAREQLDAMQSTVTALALSISPVAPPSDLRAKVLASTHSEPRTERIETVRRDEGQWIPHEVEGVFVKVLAIDKQRHNVTMLLRMNPGTVFPVHQHHGTEETYVVEGEFEANGGKLIQGDFLHAESGSGHGPFFSATGCTLLLVVAEEDFFRKAS